MTGKELSDILTNVPACERDLHTHTVFSDGADTPEKMVLAAIARGMKVIGFTDHSYTAFDESYCMKKEAIPAYRAEIARLKSKYGDRITVLCGIEQDRYSKEKTDGYDYVIGSVHYIHVGEGTEARYVPVDEDPDTVLNTVRTFFDGDFYAYAETYFRTAAEAAEATGADIIGHFDLIAKFNEKTPVFDEHHPRYVTAWQTAADRLIRAGIPFEINTGAMSRGYRSVPYPSDEMRTYIRKRGGRFLLSGDTHNTKTLCYAFDLFEER